MKNTVTQEYGKGIEYGREMEG